MAQDDPGLSVHSYNILMLILFCDISFMKPILACNLQPVTHLVYLLDSVQQCPKIFLCISACHAQPQRPYTFRLVQFRSHGPSMPIHHKEMFLTPLDSSPLTETSPLADPFPFKHRSVTCSSSPQLAATKPRYGGLGFSTRDRYSGWN